MLGIVLALLLQTSNPVQPAQSSPQAEPATTQTTEAQPEQATSGEEAQTQRRRCRNRGFTGTRLVAVCRVADRYQDQNTRDTMRDIQRIEPGRAG